MNCNANAVHDLREKEAFREVVKIARVSALASVMDSLTATKIVARLSLVEHDAPTIEEDVDAWLASLDSAHRGELEDLAREAREAAKNAEIHL